MKIYSSLLDIEEKTHSLSHLLPYDPSVKTGSRFLDGIKEYSLLVNAVELAMLALQNGDLREFDPLVGENACQIRAVRIAIISIHGSVDIKTLLERTQLAKQKIEELSLEVNKLIRTPISLQDVLVDHGVEINLSDDEIYLIMSYLLTRIKVVRPFSIERPLLINEYTDTKKIKELGNVGSLFSHNLVRKLREKLSESSSRYVLMQSQELSSISSEVEQILERFSIIYRGMQCAPCFWTNQVLMKLILSNRIPIVLLAMQRAKDLGCEIVKKTAIYLLPTSDGYQETEFSSLPADTTALVLVGNTCRDSDQLPDLNQWREDLLEYCPTDLMLAYASKHRQYPDIAQEHLVNEIVDTSFDDYKEKAEEWGCCLENPTRFFLAHAACSKIGKIEFRDDGNY